MKNGWERPERDAYGVLRNVRVGCYVAVEGSDWDPKHVVAISLEK